MKVKIDTVGEKRCILRAVLKTYMSSSSSFLRGNKQECWPSFGFQGGYTNTVTGLASK